MSVGGGERESEMQALVKNNIRIFFITSLKSRMSSRIAPTDSERALQHGWHQVKQELLLPGFEICGTQMHSYKYRKPLKGSSQVV